MCSLSATVLVEPFPLERVAEIAQELARASDARLECSMAGGIPPSELTIAPANAESAATVIISTADPGIVAVQVGRGMHGEFIVRGPRDVPAVIQHLQAVPEASIEGGIVERVSRTGAQRYFVRGTINADRKTYRWWRHTYSPNLRAGVVRYRPYAR